MHVFKTMKRHKRSANSILYITNIIIHCDRDRNLNNMGHSRDIGDYKA